MFLYSLRTHWQKLLVCGGCCCLCCTHIASFTFLNYLRTCYEQLEKRANGRGSMYSLSLNFVNCMKEENENGEKRGDGQRIKWKWRKANESKPKTVSPCYTEIGAQIFGCSHGIISFNTFLFARQVVMKVSIAKLGIFGLQIVLFNRMLRFRRYSAFREARTASVTVDWWSKGRWSAVVRPSVGSAWEEL